MILRPRRSRVSSTPSSARQLRGVTMLEMMVVIALLGIIATLATPNLLPIVKKARLNVESETVASFLNGVRERAIAKNRCYRVRLINANRTLVAEERNSGDCSSTVQLTNDGWITDITRLTADKGTTYLFAATDVNASTGTVANDLVFRPSGRLRGDNDLNTIEDRVRIRVQQTGITGEKNIVVMPSGRICIIHIQTTPPAMSPANAQNDCSLAIP